MHVNDTHPDTDTNAYAAHTFPTTPKGTTTTTTTTRITTIPANLKFPARGDPKVNITMQPEMFGNGMKDPAALRWAPLQKEEEIIEQAVLEQMKLEGLFQEARERGRQQREREKERETGHVKKEMRKEWERIEKEKAAALRRAVEEEVMIAQKQRMLQEQMEKQAALKAEEEIKAEWERKRAEKERQVRKKVRELEQAAVAKAVEESIITEAARKLVEREESEKKRVEAVAERMMREAEAKAREDRLRRRVEGKKGQNWTRGGAGVKGFYENVGVPGGGLRPLGTKIDDIRAFVEDGPDQTPSSPFINASRRTYPGDNMGKQGPLPEPNWYQYPPPLPNMFSPADEVKSDTYVSGRLDAGHEFDGFGQPGDTVWRGTGRETRHWRETTTERWETFTERENGGDGAYRRHKEGSGSTHQV